MHKAIVAISVNVISSILGGLVLHWLTQQPLVTPSHSMPVSFTSGYQASVKG